jgi:hypothetical protein
MVRRVSWKSRSGPFLYSEGGEELLWNERKSEKKLSWVDFEPAFDFEVGRRTL